ncbi:MAG: hypothetical protein L3J36_16500, partial [Rhodobacteraceae bacterium]|nr:hypothetical protein [Paracoccaceae bacterium]
WAIAADGDARDGDGIINMTGVVGEVKAAFLYWGELNFSGSSDTEITLNGNAVSGTKLGTSVDTCWGSDHSVGYFADVTAYVNGDGTYNIEGMGEGGQGASLVIVYDDGDETNNRDITIFAGNDATNTPGAVTTIDLEGITYESGDVSVTLNVGDGQSYTDGDLTVNGNFAGTNLFPGAAGDLWDVLKVDLKPFLEVGDNQVKLEHVSEGDCLQFVSAIVDVKSSKPVVFLDFETALPVDFYVTSYINGDGKTIEQVGQKSGTEPVGVFTDTQKSQLVKLVQDIFDRSDIELQVTSEKPAVGSYHSVRYSSDNLTFDTTGDGTDNARLLGKAYQGVDRYNKNDDDIVAVFMDGSDPLLKIAETTVHEVAHAFGGRHINPVVDSGKEVLDYDSQGLEEFYDKVAFITEPPVDGTKATKVSHNPTYHIRKYVLGESDEDLKADGVTPGTWDRGFFNNILYSLGLVDLVDNLTSLALLIPNQSDIVEGDDSENPLGTLVPLSLDIAGLEVLTFSLPEGVPFKIVGSTTDETVLDVVVEFDPDAKDPFTHVSSASTIISGKFVTNLGDEIRKVVGTIDIESTEVKVVKAGPPELSVSIDKTFLIESSGSATVTISRGDNTEGDLKIILVSDDTSEASVPNEVIIPDGESQVQVTLDALDDSLNDGVVTVTVTAIADDFKNGTATIDILDDESPLLHVSISESTITELDGEATVTITRNTGSSGDLTVTMSSDDISEASLPASVVIPDGEISVTVLLSAVPDLIVDGTQTVTITAAADGFDSGVATVDVSDSDTNEPENLKIIGTKGDDVLVGGKGDDLVIGRSGDDELTGKAGVDVLRGGTGNDLLFGGRNADKLKGNAGEDILKGGKGSDIVVGGSGNDKLFGNEHSDTLKGGNGNDKLFGQGGHDRLIAGKGTDILLGGSGDDVFVFRQGDGINTIKDFEKGSNQIEILRGAESFGDLQITNSNGDAVIQFANVTIRVENSQAIEFTESDFIF